MALRSLHRAEGAIDFLRPQDLQVVADAHLVAKARTHRLSRALDLHEVKVKIARTHRARALDHRHAAAKLGAPRLRLAVAAAREADVR